MTSITSFIIKPTDPGLFKKQIIGACALYGTKHKHKVGRVVVEGESFDVYHPFKDHDEFCEAFVKRIRLTGSKRLGKVSFKKHFTLEK